MSAICGCAATSVSTSATPPSVQSSPAQTSSAPAASVAPPLPAGFTALSEKGLRIGVPKSWVRIPAAASAATIQRIEARHPQLKGRFSAASTPQPSAGRMFATDPTSTGQLLVLVFPTPGITASGAGLLQLYKTQIKPVFAADNVKILAHHLTKLGGRDDLRVTGSFVKNAITVREIIDLAFEHDRLFDLTFSGAAAAIKEIEATVFINP